MAKIQIAMKVNISHSRWAAPLALAIIFSFPGAGHGEEVSAWAADLRSAMRLIAGTALPGRGTTPLRAGIELRLDPGWKTYWRYAGDSGLPPKFDFSGSQNIKSAIVLWPAPQRFPDGAGGHSIGYMGGVILPVHIVAEDPAKPVTLRAKVNYGVCEKICIPAEGEAQLLLTAGPSSKEPAIAAAEARVPKPAALGGKGSLAIRSARYDASGEQPRVIVEVTVPPRASVDLFAEGPEPRWSLPLPRLVGSSTGKKRRFAFDVDGVPPGAGIVGAPLTLTLVTDNTAIEVTTHLD